MCPGARGEEWRGVGSGREAVTAYVTERDRWECLVLARRHGAHPSTTIDADH